MASLTALVRASPWFSVTGGTTGGGAATVVLFSTDLTPLTPATADWAIDLVASSFTSPVIVATPEFTFTFTAEQAGSAASAFSAAALMSASFGALLQE